MENQSRVFPVTLVIAIALVVLFFLALFNSWFGVSTSVGAEFCEASRPGLIKQPANTWSNVGFITAGLLIAWQVSSGRFKAFRNVFTQSNFTAIFFSTLAVFLGPASMAMHATETEIGGNLDMLSMYLMAGFTTAYAIQRFFRLGSLPFTLIFSAVVILCVCVQDLPLHMPLLHYFGDFMFGFFVTLTILFELLNSFVRKMDHDIKWALLSFGSLMLAFGIWNMWLNDGPLCDPHSLIQGHAIWHLLDALAVYFLFRFYVSEHTHITKPEFAAPLSSDKHLG
jgi:hypothetical protein